MEVWEDMHTIPLSRVHKRSVLELILFNIFINDLDGWIDQVGMSMLEERIGI